MNEKKIIQVPVTFDAVARRKDRSVRLAFTSNLELSSPELMKLDEMLQASGWLIFSENELKEEDLPEADAPGEQRKSKIQRLRGAYYVYWKQKTDMAQTFEQYWDDVFETIMSRVKDRLD